MKKATQILFLCAILCTLAFGQGVVYWGPPVANGQGQPIAGASVAISTVNPCGSAPGYAYCGGSPSGVYSGPLPPASLTTLYTDITVTGTATNPLTSDPFGNWPVYLANSGTYWATFYGSVLQPQVQAFTIGGSGGGTSSLSFTYPNSSDGTICNSLAKVDQTAGSSTLGKATNTTGDELLILGAVTSGCGTTGQASIQFAGNVQLVFDSASPTVGDAAGISSSTPGAAHDLGSAAPTSTSTVIGTIVLNPTTGGLPTGCTIAPGCYVELTTFSIGGGSVANALVSNPGATATNTIAPTASTVIPISPGCNSGAGSTQQCLNVTNGSGTPVLVVQNNGQTQVGPTTGTVKNMQSGTSSNSDLDGTLTMSSGTATYTWTGTYSVHPTCTASDETAIAAVKVTYTSTTSVTFTTSGSSDVIDYHCIGRN